MNINHTVTVSGSCFIYLYLFISPKRGSSSIKYSKHNIQQNKQTEKKLIYTFTYKSVNLLSNFVTRLLATNRLAFQMKNILDNIWHD